MADPAETLDGVIERLNEIIEQSKSNQSRLGYFAALYRKVTCRVKECIEEGNYFDNNERMEKLDVIFASRYLTAFDQMQSGGDPGQSHELQTDVSTLSR
jgi:hypothetical protein